MATYKDIRAATGLSLATISKYFNNRPVLPQNAVAIEAAAQALNFRVNDFARRLRGGSSRSVGVVLPDLSSPFYLTVLGSIEAELRQHNISLIIRASHAEEGDESAAEFLAGRMVDGIVAVPSKGELDPLRSLRARGLPVVLLDVASNHPDFDIVDMDNRHASVIAVDHLVDHGHREIALISNEETPTMRQRNDGFRQRMGERNVPVRDEFIALGSFSVEAGRAAMRRLLALPQRPTAVFCTTDHLSVGAQIALSEAGLTVPRDMSVLGFDIPQTSRMLRPAMTIIAQDPAEIARHAASLLLARLQASDSSTRHVSLQGQLIIGGSVGPR